MTIARDLTTVSAADNGLGAMAPFFEVATDRLAVLGACPLDDLITIGFTTVSLV
jgi:hypothetical protein